LHLVDTQISRVIINLNAHFLMLNANHADIRDWSHLFYAAVLNGTLLGVLGFDLFF
jgi:hypothetical protein